MFQVRTLSQIMPCTLIHLGKQKGLLAERDTKRHVALVKEVRELLQEPSETASIKQVRQW